MYVQQGNARTVFDCDCYMISRVALCYTQNSQAAANIAETKLSGKCDTFQTVCGAHTSKVEQASACLLLVLLQSFKNQNQTG